MERLQKLADELAPGRIQFRGRVGRREVHDAMRSALAVLVPSRWYENQPITILEAFACAVPVIGTRLGGIPELVEDGITGITTPANDPPALAAAMRELASRIDRAGDMGLAARARVERDFSPASHLARLDEIYSEARGVPAAVPA